MKRINRFVLTAALGGFLGILPLLIIYKLFIWLIALFSDTVSPWTGILMRCLDIEQLTAELLIFIFVFAFCFVLGAIVKTRIGGWAHNFLESNILARIPGYLAVKDIIKQFSGGGRGMFRKVVKVSLSDDPNGPFLTGLITDEYENNQVTVFVPTGPNPTTGLILHTSRDRLTELNASVESAMKTIISCGAGSGKLLNSGGQDKQPAAKAADR